MSIEFRIVSASLFCNTFLFLKVVSPLAGMGMWSQVPPSLLDSLPTRLPTHLGRNREERHARHAKHTEENMLLIPSKNAPFESRCQQPLFVASDRS